MKLHANARLSVKGRQLLVDRLAAGWSLTEAAVAAGVSERTARKWRDRHRAEGEEGLLDRSSAPKSVPARTAEDRIQLIAGAVDGVGHPDPDRDGQARPPGPGAGAAL